MNENFADIGVEVADVVERWADLPEPSGETSSNGNPKVYRVSKRRLFVADTGDSWTIIGGLGSEAIPLPSVNTKRLETTAVSNSTNHSTTQVSHTRYVGPDDPSQLPEFDVEEGDVWVKTE
jgi:hypothetical protein